MSSTSMCLRRQTCILSRQNGKLAGNEGSENYRRSNATDEPAVHDDLGSGDNDTSKIDQPPAVCGKAVFE